jgi:hypothetical protein
LAFYLLALPGCAKHHVISTIDGRMNNCANNPELNSEMEIVAFKNA